MSNFSIGVVTYVKRFEQYFVPIVRQLDELFPNVHKTYILNGYYDQAVQQEYLAKAKEFLAKTTASKVITYDEHQSLAKCWNQLIINSPTEKILVLNDDVVLSRLFKWSFLLQQDRFEQATINKSWSHFLISKNFVKKVGWFDERYVGVGFEDGDFVLRIAQAFGMKRIWLKGLHYLYCPGLKNIIADNKDPGWKKISGNYGNKYTQANFEFFQTKWERRESPSEGFIDFVNAGYFQLKPGMETPQFYDFSVLDTKSAS